LEAAHESLLNNGTPVALDLINAQAEATR
jgi:hypothetical protein